MAGVGLEMSVGGNWEEGVGKMNHNCNAPVGPPISWVPPGISLPPNSFNEQYCTTHIPLGRGGAGAAEYLRHCLLCPHPSREGRGR